MTIQIKWGGDGDGSHLCVEARQRREPAFLKYVISIITAHCASLFSFSSEKVGEKLVFFLLFLNGDERASEFGGKEEALLV